MEDRLRFLYALQRVDSSLDDLQELKGDLPRMVEELKTQLQERKKQRDELRETVKHSHAKRDETDTEIISLKEKIEKYKTQQFQVKTNKQYDALAREIDHSQESITRLMKEMDVLEGRAALAKEDSEKMGPEIESMEADLAKREEELEAVNKEHEEEEHRLRHEREKLTHKIQKGDLQMYERIRKAKGGKAIVPVRRNACGGCYNRVPPQTVLELRKNSRIIPCERCGRVLVSDEIVESYSKVS